jgi:hypothetical protein
MTSCSTAGRAPASSRSALAERRSHRPRRSGKRVKQGTPLVVASSDGGSGIDPASVVVSIDGAEQQARFTAGRVRISTSKLTKAAHVLRFQISDYQESRNMENVGPILPNTRILTTTIVVT